MPSHFDVFLTSVVLDVTVTSDTEFIAKSIFAGSFNELVEKLLHVKVPLISSASQK